MFLLSVAHNRYMMSTQLPACTDPKTARHALT